MANVKQTYTVGQPFNVYTYNELSSLDSDAWTWSHRTLSCYMSELCGMIPLGQEITLNAQTEKLSGVWTLNKDVYIRLCCIQAEGIEGQISVVFEESCNGKPNFDKDLRPYHVFNTLTETSSYYMYYGTSAMFEVSAAPGTVITDIKFTARGGDYAAGSGWSEYTCIRKYDGNTQIDASKSLQEGIKYKYFANMYSKPCLYLSVWYAGQGVIEYFSNKNTLNPQA